VTVPALASVIEPVAVRLGGVVPQVTVPEGTSTDADAPIWLVAPGLLHRSL
jgi:hypothetical protein